MYGSADDHRSMDITRITKGSYGVYAVYIKVVAKFLDSANEKSGRFKDIWEILGTWCKEMGKCLILMAPRPRIYVRIFSLRMGMTDLLHRISPQVSKVRQQSLPIPIAESEEGVSEEEALGTTSRVGPRAVTGTS